MLGHSSDTASITGGLFFAKSLNLFCYNTVAVWVALTVRSYYQPLCRKKPISPKHLGRAILRFGLFYATLLLGKAVVILARGDYHFFSTVVLVCF